MSNLEEPARVPAGGGGRRSGLANFSGAVGKHLMFNTYFGVNAQFEHPLNEFKSVQNTRWPSGRGSTSRVSHVEGRSEHRQLERTDQRLS